jgi:polyisoprenoid-binding protein YceI
MVSRRSNCRKPQAPADIYGWVTRADVEISYVSTLTGIDRATLVPPGRWVLDPARSSVGFDVRHLKLIRVRGRFRDVEGAILCDRDGNVSIVGSIDVASIDTGDSRRDARLREEGLFDVQRHPKIGVSLSSAAGTYPGVRGTMTICGVKQPVELYIDGPPAPAGGNGGLRVRAFGYVSRRAFGLDWDPAFAAGGLVIDDRVTLRLDVVLVHREE